MSWVAAYCEANREFVACAKLRAQGIDVFCPYESVDLKKRSPNRPGQHISYSKDIAVFAPYLFVNSEEYALIRKTLGVICLVNVEGKPIIINSVVIDSIKSTLHCNENGLMPKGHWFKGQVGDRVELDGSALKGLMAKITDITEIDVTEQITVTIEMLGSERNVKVPVADIKLRS
jgi:transcription antitermination factor NusG